MSAGGAPESQRTGARGSTGRAITPALHMALLCHSMSPSCYTAHFQVTSDMIHLKTKRISSLSMQFRFHFGSANTFSNTCCFSTEQRGRRHLMCALQLPCSPSISEEQTQYTGNSQPQPVVEISPEHARLTLLWSWARYPHSQQLNLPGHGTCSQGLENHWAAKENSVHPMDLTCKPCTPGS